MGMMKGDVTVIGRATAERDVVMVDGGRKSPLPNKGYEHFKG
jgi:thiamine monophosphate kinase